jgi:hypothetical protein
MMISSLIALLMVFATTAFAQFENGAVSGVVTDPSGAVISGAQITVTSLGTGAARTATTDNSGNYTVSSLKPGEYELKVSQQGFGDYKQRFTVPPGGRTSVDAKMATQAAETTIEVVGRAETQVDTETSSISQTVNQKRVAELPTLTRDPYDFVQTMGNVNQDSASGTGGEDQVIRGAGVSINGQRSSSTDILLDGGENVDLYTTKVGQTVPLDAVSEFSVTSNNFSAEYGRSSGGVINVVTKSGTNDFHGSLYEFNRLSALTSEDVDNVALGNPKQKYTRNQFGYSIGGPIKKNKMFFFSTTEWTRVRSSASTTAAIPAPEFLALTSPATQAVFTPFQLRPGLTQNSVLTANDLGYTSVAGTTPIFDVVSYPSPSDSGGGQPQNTYNMVHRVDFNLSNKTTLYARYAYFHQNEFAGSVNSSPWVGFDTGQFQRNHNALLSLTHVWSPTVVSETKFNFNRLNFSQPLSSQQPVQPSFYFNVNFLETAGPYNTCLPGYSCFTPGNSIPFGGPQNVAQFAQSLSWNKGNHDLRFGGQYVYTQDNRTFGAYEEAVQGFEPFGGTSLTDGLDQMLLGSAGWFQVVIDPQGKFPCIKDATGAYNVTPECTVNLPTTQPSFARSNIYRDGALYAQDTWKVKPRFTLNLGIRWEYYGVQHNKDPRLDSNFVFGPGSFLLDRIRSGRVYTVAATANSPASPVGGLWNPQYHNFAPRIGFAWDVFGDGKTSLRGGYGIGYERNFGNVTFNVIQNPPAQFNSFFQGDFGEIPVSTNNLGPFAGTGTKFLPNPSLRYVRQDLPTAYAESWNLSLQREVFRNSILAFEYTGSHGVHLYSIENENQRGWGNLYMGTDPFVDNPMDRPNRQYGNMNTRGANGFSKYNALNTRFASNNLFHAGLDVNVNYTWSHSIDNLSSSFSETPQTENLGLLDPLQPALDTGDADYDARHRIAFSAVWDIPYAKGTHGFVRQALDGWELAPVWTAHSGNPFTVFDSNAFNGDTVVARYFAPGGAPPRTGSTASVPTTGYGEGPNAFTYMTLPASSTYYNQLIFDATGGVAGIGDTTIVDGELPTCGVTTNAGNTVSTGQSCTWPSNMTGRNYFRGPGWYNINLAIRKTFPVTERYKLQFSSEFYNLLNHSNYYVQSGSFADMGNTCATNNPNVIANLNGCSSPDYQVFGKRGVNPAFGVPNERRFVQFALKFLF